MSLNEVADERTVEVGGLRVRYLVAGDGSPVVLLHGGGVDSATLSWRRTIPALAERFTVYAPDWPGYGDSEFPEAEPSVAWYAEFLEAFLDRLELQEASLVGISMGGGVALSVALDRPERVTRLVLVDSLGLGGAVPGGYLGYLFTRLPYVSEVTWALLRRSRRLWALSLRGIVGDPEAVTPDLVDDVVRAGSRPDAGRTFRAFQRAEVGPAGLRTNVVDRLPELRVPTLLVHGEADPLVPVEWAVRAGVLVPDAEVRILPNCGHWPPRERPERFVGLVEAYLAE
ncbi:alpha/beta fold hydrolase [Halobium salinum]|uniref:Alpha/beta fold hydrolase n=1 Tax=Halobium salinum TaxID=1364940 RepID=A0ABD5PDZ8_9EURY|nr:alpha/beta fold hydrolase [Halobium salinum]